MRTFWVFALAAMAAVPAEAAIVTIDWTGSAHGSDPLHIFSPDDAFESANTPYTLTVTYDTSAAAGITSPPDTGYTAWGGSQWGTAPFGTAVLTINGVTYSWTGALHGILAYPHPTPGDDASDNFFSTTIDGTTSDGAVNMQVYGRPSTDGGFPSDLESFSASGSNLTQKDGWISIIPPGASGDQYDHIEIFPSSVSVTVSGADGVPEPAIWLTMIAGFGLVGGAMRTARKRGLKLA